MQVVTIPPSQGITEDELARLLDSGWVCLGILPIVKRHGIATPSDPAAGLSQPHLVLARQEPMVAAKQVAGILVLLDSGQETPDSVAQKLFGVPLRKLRGN